MSPEPDGEGQQGQQRHRHGQQDAQVEVVQGVDVGGETAQETAAALPLQAGRGKGLQDAVEPAAQVGE